MANTRISRLSSVTAVAVLTAIGTQNTAMAAATFLNVLSDQPLEAIPFHNNGIIDPLQASPAVVVSTAMGDKFFYRYVQVRGTAYGTAPIVNMTASQFDALVNPSGADLTTDQAAKLITSLPASTNSATNLLTVGHPLDALSYGFLGSWTPLTIYRPVAGDPALDRVAYGLGLVLRILSMLWLVIAVIRFVRRAVMPAVRGAVGSVTGEVTGLLGSPRGVLTGPASARAAW